MIAAVAGVAVLLALAAPFLGCPVRLPRRRQQRRGQINPAGLRLGQPTASGRANGPLVLVADVTGSDPDSLDALTDDLAATDGVAGSDPRCN